ncbi:hypothetical protein KR018_002710 [Drosophila ironensis]|nr:hypothetical protein KR018_002710 [Drosophila ironensis]
MLRKKKNRGIVPSLAVHNQVSTDPDESAHPSYTCNGPSQRNQAAIEDLISGEISGTPFILVDSAMVNSHDELDAALEKLETQRIQEIEAELEENNTLKLDDVTPPGELNLPIMCNEVMLKMKADEEERRFQEDMRSLYLEPPSGDDNISYDTNISGTSTATEPSEGTASNMERIRSKLEELRKLQNAIMTPTPEVVAERPSIRRQGTFEVVRPKVSTKEAIAMPIISTQSPPDSKKPSQLIRTHTFNSLECQGEDKSTYSALETQHIINQIGDLLLQFQLHREDQKKIVDGSTYSYMVTIAPTGGVANCSVTAIPDQKPTGVLRPIPDCKKLTMNLPSPRGKRTTTPPAAVTPRPRISRVAVNSIRIDGSYFGSNNPRGTTVSTEPSVSQIKTHYVRQPAGSFLKAANPANTAAKRTGSFLKVPNSAKYCHGRTRE